MKWFKHMTDSADDEKLALLVDRCGLEGYGFWWRVMEIIAKNVDENNKTAVTYSIKKWCNILQIRPQTFRKLLANLTETELAKSLCVEKSNSFKEVLFTIDIPNILKYRDEYSQRKHKKSGQTPDTVGTSFKDTEEELKEELYITPPSPPLEKNEEILGGECEQNLTHVANTKEQNQNTRKTDCPSKSHAQYRAFKSCYAAYPVQQGEEQAWCEWMRLHENGTLDPPYFIHEKIVSLANEDSRWLRGKAPLFANFLKNKRWLDTPYLEPENGNIYSAMYAPRKSAGQKTLENGLEFLNNLENGGFYAH